MANQSSVSWMYLSKGSWHLPTSHNFRYMDRAWFVVNRQSTSTCVGSVPWICLSKGTWNPQACKVCHYRKRAWFVVNWPIMCNINMNRHRWTDLPCVFNTFFHAQWILVCLSLSNNQDFRLSLRTWLYLNTFLTFSNTSWNMPTHCDHGQPN